MVWWGLTCHWSFSLSILKPLFVLFEATDLSHMVLPQSGSLSDNQSSACVLFFCAGTVWVIFLLILGLVPTFTCWALGEPFQSK